MMTTIAWDGETLAADSMVSGDRSVFRQTNKIQKLSNGAVFVICGEFQDIALSREWFESDKSKDKPTLSDGCSGLYIDIDGKFFMFESKLSLFPVNKSERLADGSGWQWAMAAMDHGKSAIEAVEYAATKDIYTGGQVNSVKL